MQSGAVGRPDRQASLAAGLGDGPKQLTRLPEQQLDGTLTAPAFTPLPPHPRHEARRTARIGEGRLLRTLGLDQGTTRSATHRAAGLHRRQGGCLRLRAAHRRTLHQALVQDLAPDFGADQPVPELAEHRVVEFGVSQSSPPGSGDASLHPRPLRTVRARRPSTRLKQAPKARRQTEVPDHR
ncbi:hypothetical protein FNV64_04925 [Streptomyces sp. S1A1-7]|nr:hypothetical protein FNV64_04925 [Streptomyces sp. S1A1-7]